MKRGEGLGNQGSLSSSPCRLMERTRLDSATGCRIWTGASSPAGYGRVKVGGKLRGAHQVSWEANFGAIPDGMFVCHTCDNPPCIEPTHLFLGTRSDNMLDCSAKGRLFLHTGMKRRAESIRRGDQATPSKLTEQSVREIRQLRSGGMTFTELGQRYGVDQSTVRSVVARKTWAHVA
jgi:hypothetical protein